jgi:hypothetical protein
LGTLKALGDFDDPWSILGNWLMLALPLSLVIAVARYVIDSADERRAEGLAKGQRLAAIQVVEFDRLNSGEEALDTASLVADDSPSLPSPPMPDSPAE